MLSGTLRPRLLNATVQLENSAGLEICWCFQTSYKPKSNSPKHLPISQKSRGRKISKTTDNTVFHPTHSHYIKRLCRKQASSSCCCCSPLSAGTSALDILVLLICHRPSQNKSPKLQKRIYSIMCTSHLSRHFTFQRLCFSVLELIFSQLLASVTNHKELNLAPAEKLAASEPLFLHLSYWEGHSAQVKNLPVRLKTCLE